MVTADRLAKLATSFTRIGEFKLAFHDPIDSELTDWLFKMDTFSNFMVNST